MFVCVLISKLLADFDIRISIHLIRTHLCSNCFSSLLIYFNKLKFEAKAKGTSLALKKMYTGQLT